MSKCQQRCFSKSFVAEASIHVAYIGQLKKGTMLRSLLRVMRACDLSVLMGACD